MSGKLPVAAKVALGLNLSLAMIFSFQNCSKVDLTLGSAETLNTASGELKLCLPDGLTFESVLIQNLNLAFGGDGFEIDSDADGLSDQAERRIGLNPLKRMTYGKISDRLCTQFSPNGDCSSIAQNCSSDTTLLGLNECEIEALNLSSIVAHSTQGLDSDGDGITDLFEILRGTLANENDSNEDPDRDLITNFQEFQLNSNPVRFNKKTGSSLIILANKVNDDTNFPNCAGEKWQVSIANVVFAPSGFEFNNTATPTHENHLTFSHPEYANQILMVIKLKPQLGSTSLPRIYFRTKLVSIADSELSSSIIDFVFAGEVLK